MKDILLAPFYFVYKLWIGVVFWVTLLCLYLPFLILLSNKSWYGHAFTLKRIWSAIICTLILCPIRTISKSQLPEGPFIIICNHSSHLDIVFLYRVMPRYFSFVGKGELLRWPLFRLFFRTSDIPVDRGNSKSAYRSLQKAYDLIDEGRCIAIFPEGTIPLTSPRMKAFKNGAFRMAIDKQVPIVPVTWRSNFRIMNNPEKIFSPSRPGISEVIIHPPIYTDGREEQDLVALRQQAFQVINNSLPEAYRKNNQHD